MAGGGTMTCVMYSCNNLECQNYFSTKPPFPRSQTCPACGEKATMEWDEEGDHPPPGMSYEAFEILNDPDVDQEEKDEVYRE
jgi:hypothetical protein